MDCLFSLTPLSRTLRGSLSLGRLPKNLRVVLTGACLGLVLGASPALAAEEETVLRARAATLAERGDCASALTLLDEARNFDAAGDFRADTLRARCLVDLERYDDARPILERLATEQPSSGEAALALGITRYELGDFDGALAELERAEALLPDRPEPPLYEGLALIARGENAVAAERFERSNQRNTDGFDPVSGYYAAVAHAGAGDMVQADEALRRVEERGAGTVWGDRAAELLSARSERARQLPLDRWLTVQGGIDYDTNVALRGDQITRPGNISSDDDFRGWWAIDAGADLWQRDGWRVGAGARYSGFEYFRAEDFRQHFVTARTWLDRALGERTLLRIAPEAGVGFFDTAEYLRFYGVRPEIRQDWGEYGSGTFFVRYAYNDFREEFDTQTSFQDRDGHDIRGGYDHQVPVSDTTTLRGGIFGRHYAAEGGEYDHSGVGGWLGIGQQLPWSVTFDASVSYAHDFYEAESSFLQPGEIASGGVGDRDDDIVLVNAQLARPITDWLSVAARYQYLNNISNTQVFDYDRHIVGAYFTLDLLGLLSRGS